MKNLLLRTFVAALALLSAPSFGQGTPTAPLYKSAGGSLHEGSVDKIMCSPDVGVTWVPCNFSGGGGSSGGTATAANPTYSEGATSQALSLDLSGRLRTLSTISGTLPAFASTPTFNLGTLNGAALDATLSTLSGKIPSTLGAKTGANSLSVVPNSDTPFPAAGSVARGSTISGNPFLDGCRGKAASPTAVTDNTVIDFWCLLNGQLVMVITDSSGNVVNVNNQSASAISNGGGNYALNTNALSRIYSGSSWVPGMSIVGALNDGTGAGAAAVEQAGALFNNITTATTTTVKSGKGILHKLVLNTYVASATITIYDNTAASGTKIGTITLPSTITSTAPITLPYDLEFTTGLTIVTSGATDETVIYR